MKKLIFYLFFILILIIKIIYFYQQNYNLVFKNNKLYEKFVELNLVDVNGDISLISVKSIRDTQEEKFTELYGDNALENVEKILAEKHDMNEELTLKFSELNGQIVELESKVSNLNSQYEQLKKSKEISYTINGVPTINQYPNYPTGCESIALTILLNYHGVNVSPSDIISKLKKGSLPYYEQNVLYGGNPEVEFVGNPLSSGGFGVYEKPIAEVANIYKTGIIIRENFAFSNVLNLVKNGTPVLVWSSMGLSVPYISTSWIYKPTNEIIQWKANEHAVVIFGYNDNYVIISDPMGGKVKYQSISVFEQRYNYFGKKALYYEV